MQRRELERLTTVSIRGRLYVAVDEVLELIKAKEQAAAETTPARTLPRQPDKDT